MAAINRRRKLMDNSWTQLSLKLAGVCAAAGLGYAISARRNARLHIAPSGACDNVRRSSKVVMDAASHVRIDDSSMDEMVSWMVKDLKKRDDVKNRAGSWGADGDFHFQVRLVVDVLMCV